MRDSKTLTESLSRKLKSSSTNSPTAAGPAGSEASDSEQPITDAHIDAINQLFTELELAYHNQFHKAFPGDKTNVAKQLWLHSLLDLSPEEILRGGRRSIKESAYLPTLHTIREMSRPGLKEFGLPDVHSAYLEACRAPSPKAAYEWSHPAVYHAGRAADWYFLANNPERSAFPVFREHYQRLCQQVIDGEELTQPDTPALPQEHSTPLSLEERREKLRELRRELDL